MRIKNTEQRYGLVAILFHWTIAALVIAMIAIGLYMTDLSVSPLKMKLYRWHKQIGVIVLALVCLRLAWRTQNIVPLQSPTVPRWQVLAAKGVHFALYALLILLPLTGWSASSAGGVPVSFFGLFLLPDFVPTNHTLFSTFIETHHILAFIIIGIICVHIAAIFQHLLIHKENILSRMWP